MNDDLDAILWGIDLAKQLGQTHPRLAGAALLVIALVIIPSTLWGFVSANVDREAMRAKGQHRRAAFFDRGAEWGPFAVTILKSLKRKKTEA